MTPEEYAKIHKDSFRAAFEFLASHFPPVDTEEWWIQAAKDVGYVSDLHGNSKLIIGLLNGVYDYIADECMRRRKDEAEH